MRLMRALWLNQNSKAVGSNTKNNKQKRRGKFCETQRNRVRSGSAELPQWALIFWFEPNVEILSSAALKDTLSSLHLHVDSNQKVSWSFILKSRLPQWEWQKNETCISDNRPLKMWQCADIRRILNKVVWGLSVSQHASGKLQGTSSTFTSLMTDTATIISRFFTHVRAEIFTVSRISSLKRRQDFTNCAAARPDVSDGVWQQGWSEGSESC